MEKLVGRQTGIKKRNFNSLPEREFSDSGFLLASTIPRLWSIRPKTAFDLAVTKNFDEKQKLHEVVVKIVG